MAYHDNSRIRRVFQALQNVFASDHAFPASQGEAQYKKPIDDFDLFRKPSLCPTPVRRPRDSKTNIVGLDEASQRRFTLVGKTSGHWWSE